jgi:hypothetical protein
LSNRSEPVSRIEMTSNRSFQLIVHSPLRVRLRSTDERCVRLGVDLEFDAHKLGAQPDVDPRRESPAGGSSRVRVHAG